MKTHTIAILAVSLAILGCVYYFDYKRLVEREAAEVQLVRLFASKPEAVRSIDVRNRFGSIKLERREDAWWIVAPIEERADQQAVETALLGALDKATKSGNFDLPPDHLADFGFTDAAPVITIVPDDAKPLQLALGKDTPIRGQIYLRDSVNPAWAWIAKSEIKKAFELKLLDVRDKTLLGFDLGAFASLRILHDSGEGPRAIAEVVKRGEAWALRKIAEDGESLDREFLADANYVERTLGAFKALAPADLPATASLTLAGPSAERPAIVADFGYLENAQATTASARTNLRFVSGRIEANGEEAYYAWSEGREDLPFAVSRSVERALLDPLESFRDRSIVTLQANEIGRIEIASRKENKESKTVVALDPEKIWKFEDDSDTAVRQEKVDRFVLSCLQQRVLSFAIEPQPENFEATGLGKPECRILMRSADGLRQEGFEIGSEAREGLRYARRIAGAGEAPAVESDVFLLGLPAPFLDYLREPGFAYRPILPFRAEELAQIEVTMRNAEAGTSATIVVERAEAGAASPWRARLGAGEAKALPENAAEFLLGAIDEMEYLVKARSLRGSVARAHGIDKGASTIRLLDREGKTISGISFGKGVKKESNMWIERHGGGYFYADKQVFASFQNGLLQIEGLLH